MKYLANSLYFEIDMSFKRVYGPINEWEVCAYIENYRKTNTYKKLFEELFTCVEQDCGHSVEFQHIHSCGIGCILADEHYSQALGLGQYLAERFPIFNATEHLERIYKLCTIHFKRNIRNKRGINKEIKKKMYSLIENKTAYEVMNTLVFLEHCGIAVHQKSPKKARVTNESINIEEQERLLRIEQEKLAIQKNKNDELKKRLCYGKNFKNF
ncbi:1714_t:CDS:2 [Dentiscutata heterogama]|uniref:1714_t:CDS:1 n=1 Tax=Dentiscutata heterogama TaxID=1316150 RepID=A0ACA9NE21_9GLOM|nr:1714_t:CDS:2 [Dentiscutata heterogama]